MRKVYQSIIDPKIGNCMQAAVASLFDVPLEEVPNFKEYGGSWFEIFYKFFKEKGYCDIVWINRNRHHDTELLKKIAKFDGGVNGYFYAVVKSQTFPNVKHAIIIDTDLNMVHDPNPNQLAFNITPDDILEFVSVKGDMIIGKTGKLFTEEEWNNITEEERNINTHNQYEND